MRRPAPRIILTGKTGDTPWLGVGEPRALFRADTKAMRKSKDGEYLKAFGSRPKTASKA